MKTLMMLIFADFKSSNNYSPLTVSNIGVKHP